MKTFEDFNIYDSTFLTKPFKSNCLDGGYETFEEAVKVARREYGEGCVVVKETGSIISEGRAEVEKQEVVYVVGLNRTTKKRNG